MYKRIQSSFHFATILIGLFTGAAKAQSVEPLIAEYTDHASGSFEVTNSSAFPSVVLFEAHSFTISVDGTGEFLPLDAAIHLELSSTSLRLDAHQTAHVFYKVSADHVPAWLCIYASFSSLKQHVGLNVHMLLPHTIYLYQKQPLSKEVMEISHLHYNATAHQITAEVSNQSDLAGRAQLVEVMGPHGYASQGGFPVLPHEKRILTLDWTASQAPKEIAIQFAHFALRQNFNTTSE